MLRFGIAIILLVCSVAESDSQITTTNPGSNYPPENFHYTVVFQNLQANFSWNPNDLPSAVNKTILNTQYLVEINLAKTFEQVEKLPWQQRCCEPSSNKNTPSCTISFATIDFCAYFRVKLIRDEISDQACDCPLCSCIFYSSICFHCINQHNTFTAPFLNHTFVKSDSVSVMARLPRHEILCSYPDTVVTIKIAEAIKGNTPNAPKIWFNSVEITKSWDLKTESCFADKNEFVTVFDGLKPETYYDISADYTVKPKRSDHFIYTESKSITIEVRTDKSNADAMLTVAYVSVAVVVAIASVALFTAITKMRKWRQNDKALPEFLDQVKNDLKRQRFKNFGESNSLVEDATYSFTPTSKTYSFSYVRANVPSSISSDETVQSGPSHSNHSNSRVGLLPSMERVVQVKCERRDACNSQTNYNALKSTSSSCTSSRDVPSYSIGSEIPFVETKYQQK